MKKIILLIALSLVTLYAKPCMTDIYTLNGVNTDDTSINGRQSEARKNMNALEEFMLHWGDPATRLDPQKNGQEYQFRYVYNPSYGLRDDMLETYYQLKESGQISEGYFTFILNLLTVDLGLDGIVEKYKEIVSRYEGDAQGIYNAYNTSSFSQKHNLLLVAHSQGNLMGNKIYTMLSDAQKKKFRMVSVGTPANHVMKPDQTAPYVTARNDFVINRVYGALPGNVDGIGHNFINVYLGSSFEARTKIALHVKSAYDNLMQTTSCVEGSYSYYVWISYMCPTYSAQELVVDIYGRPTDAPYPYKKQLVTSDSRIRMPYEIIDGNEICSIYGDDRLSIWPEYDKGGCYAYSLDDNHPAGTHTLDQIANKTYDNRSSCTRYQMSSEVADSLSSMLP